MRKSLLLFCGFLLVLPNCAKQKEDSVIARIGYFRNIHQSEVEQFVKQNPSSGNEQEAFRNLLNNEILYRAAQKTKFTRQTDARRQYEDAHKGWVAELFMKNVVQQNYGVLDSEIKRYYHQNKKSLYQKAPRPTKQNIAGFLTLSAEQQKDSLNPDVPLETVRAGIIDSILMKRIDVRSLYEKEKNRFFTRPHISVAHIFCKTESRINQAAAALAQGTPFEKAVETWSEDSLSRGRAGLVGVVWPGDSIPHWGPIDGLDKAAFGQGDSLIISTASVTGVVTSSHGYHIFKILDAQQRALRTYKDVAAALAQEELQQWKAATEDKYFDELKKENGVSIVDTIEPPSASEIEEYYRNSYCKDMGDSAKPLHEVKDQLVSILGEKRTETFPPDFVFARATKRFKITQKDLELYRSSMPPSIRQRYASAKGRQYLVKVLLFNELLFRQAKKSHFVRLPETVKELAMREKAFWADKFRKELLDRDLGFAEKDLRKFYLANRQMFTEAGKTKPFSDVRGEVALAMLGSPKDLERYYQLNAENFATDSGEIRPLAQVSTEVRKSYFEQEKEKVAERAMRDIRKMVGVRILKKEFADELPQNDSKLFDMAQQITSEGDQGLGRAETILLKIRRDFPESRFSKQTAFSLGQIYISKGEYPKALGEFRKILRLYGDTDYGCKAQFMLAYVYSEYIKNLDLARTAYEKTISQYPKCELVDDAQFMIKYLGKDPSEIDFLKTADATDSATSKTK